MPIDYSKYHPKWSLISRLIRFNRAQNKCEKCKVPNHAFITRDKKGHWTYRFSLKFLNGLKQEGWKPTEIAKGFDCTYIVLTVAHIDRDKTNNRFWNLAAWCQRCHLLHDKEQHIANRKYGRDHKSNNYKLEI